MRILIRTGIAFQKIKALFVFDGADELKNARDRIVVK